jgi:uncharacterized protein Usg
LWTREGEFKARRAEKWQFRVWQHSIFRTANLCCNAQQALRDTDFYHHISVSRGRRHESPGSTLPRQQRGPRMANLSLQLNDYRLTTAEVLYHLPDHPSLLQSFIWQNYDIAPRYPELRRFLDFWVRQIEGRLHSVILASRGIVSAAEIGHAGAEFRLH